MPPLVFLEEFTQGSLARWRAAGRNLERFSHDLFFALEAHRAKYSAELIDAVRSATTKRFESSGWARLVNWQFTNQPLSMAGSVRGDGGRFNIGSALDPATYTPFPALYVAEDFPTAFRERFGIDASSSIRGLTAHEFILRRESSFSHLAVNLWLENVLDVGDLSKLKPVSDILKKIRLPSRIAKAARQLRLRPPALIRTASGLQSQILSPNWRVQPVQYDLPSNSQIFGRLCVAAGVHGILYPSVRNAGRRCLALYPQNWSDTASFIELVGPCPAEVAVKRLDGLSALGN